jgi:hypothetical protein
MAIQRVPTGVAGRIGEPTAVDARFGIKNSLRRLDPINLFGRFSPKTQRITPPGSIKQPILAQETIEGAGMPIDVYNAAIDARHFFL